MTSLKSSAWLAGYRGAYPSRSNVNAHSVFRIIGIFWAGLFASKNMERLPSSPSRFTQKHYPQKRRSAHASESRQWGDLFHFLAAPAIVRSPEEINRCRIECTRGTNRPTLSAMNANINKPFDLDGQPNSKSARRISKLRPQPKQKS